MEIFSRPYGLTIQKLKIDKTFRFRGRLREMILIFSGQKLHTKERLWSECYFWQVRHVFEFCQMMLATLHYYYYRIQSTQFHNQGQTRNFLSKRKRQVWRQKNCLERIESKDKNNSQRAKGPEDAQSFKKKTNLQVVRQWQWFNRCGI